MECDALSAIDIPAGVTDIGKMAFYYCRNLNSVVLPEGLKSLENETFRGCSSLANINLPEGLTHIGDRAFQECVGLKTIKIPGSVESMGRETFRGCTNLSNLDLEEGLTYIGEWAFRECNSLSSVTIPETVTSIENDAFGYCKNLCNIDLPEGLTNIGDRAFAGCSSLNSIELPKSLINIGEDAFSYCKSLESIELPEGLESIGKSAFYACYNLSSIRIPKSVTSIGEDAFYQYNAPAPTLLVYENSYGLQYAQENDLNYIILLEDGIPFADVTDTSSWFYPYVTYVYQHNLMTGLNDTTFGPDQTLPRAQFAVILYRMNGKPQVEYTPKFPDVADGIWYTDAIIWANEAGVITGYENGLFGVNDPITREQMATMMYRYAKGKGYDVSQRAELSRFADAGQIQPFAVEAMQWAVANEIIQGMNETQLAPQGNANRAECAAIIMRFTQKYEND